MSFPHPVRRSRTPSRSLASPALAALGLLAWLGCVLWIVLVGPGIDLELARTVSPGLAPSPLLGLAAILAVAVVWAVGASRRAGEEARRSEARLRELESQLVHADRLSGIGRIAASVAHDLASPASFVEGNVAELAEALPGLGAILATFGSVARAMRTDDAARAKAAISSAEAALSGRDPERLLDDLRPLIEDCQEGMRRIQDLVRDMKDYARRDGAETAILDLDREVERGLRLLAKEVRRRCRLEKDLAAASPVRGIAGQIQQVLVNLVVNASQAVAEGGLVRVQTRDGDGEVVLRVIDDGPGIPPEILPRVFDPFFTTKPAGEGTGLGLSICRTIAERHGGRIEIDTRVGSGTTVTVRLPMADQKPDLASRLSTNRASSSQPIRR